ncbi:L-type lectin-domain containing receptor kinase IX.1-like [Ipomoea triloba]|uniref:L-type lectin-domain containing receptor kinase IX.1-like n=1 Tax=Ipomoea triloba TaxID=35885 RepID=UPI00125E39BB|nr:L-type lectin-domain containing receptor kinase IX.1-like [Ipomoea triloba]
MSPPPLCRFLKIRAFLFFLLVTLSCSLSFKIAHIDQKDANKQIEVAGHAYITDQGIQLTPYDRNRALNGKAGRAKYAEPLHLWDKATGNLADFSTHFTFNIDSDGNSSYADGLAFFLANFTTQFNESIIPGGSGLGLMDPTLIKSSDQERFVAVAFDTYSNQKDIPMKNVSINVESMRVSAISTAWINNITQGKDNNASITYNATSKILPVFFTGFSNGHYQTGSLSHEIDLRDYLPEFVSIGFSGATGMFFEKNTVSSWQFNSTLLSSNSANNVSVWPATQNHTISSLVNQEGKNKKKDLEIAGFCIAVLTLFAVLSLVIYKCFKKIKTAKGDDNPNTNGRAMGDTHQSSLVGEMDGVFQKAGTGAKKFSYSELATATNSFSEEQKLGEGGFGGVYLGFLRDLNLEVAVKRVSSQSKQGIEQYASEVKIISRLRHRNLVPLHGWCHEKGELLLVYEYMPGGSLDSHLFKRKSPLNWKLRYRIAQGLASALSYLHEEWEQCVLHRDIKSSNVLLDSSFNARLGDFGLASLIDHEKAPEKTYMGGTPGYV